MVVEPNISLVGHIAPSPVADHHGDDDKEFNPTEHCFVYCITAYCNSSYCCYMYSAEHVFSYTHSELGGLQTEIYLTIIITQLLYIDNLI